MAKCSHFMVLIVLLAVTHDAESKKPSLLFPGRLYLDLDYHEECENVPDLVIRMNNSRVRATENDLIVMDADFYSSRNIPTIKKAVITFYNCPDRASKNNCPLFQTWRIGPEICQMIMAKNQFWSPFFESITPRFRCPDNPLGKYELRNGTLDLRLMQRVPFPWEKYYWKAVYMIYDPALVYCVGAGGRFIPKRS